MQKASDNKQHVRKKEPNWNSKDLNETLQVVNAHIGSHTDRKYDLKLVMPAVEMACK